MFDGPTRDADASQGFNLSRWAIEHGSFTAFLLVLLLAAGGYSFLRIGQKEDPDFTFRVMVVQVLWPGATTEEMQEQVVDKIERKLQETPGLDFVRSYTRPGDSPTFSSTSRARVRGEAVKDAFYQVRKKIGDIRHTLPEGVLGPVLQRRVRRHLHHRSTPSPAQGFTLSGAEGLRQEGARRCCCACPASPRSTCSARRTRSVFIEVSSTALAERGLSGARHPGGARRPERAWTPAGRIETSERSVRIDVQRRLRSVEDDSRARLRAGQQTFRLGDIAEVKRGLEDPPTAKTRYQGQEAVLLGDDDGARAATSPRSAPPSSARWRASGRICPWASRSDASRTRRRWSASRSTSS